MNIITLKGGRIQIDLDTASPGVCKGIDCKKEIQYATEESPRKGKRIPIEQDEKGVWQHHNMTCKNKMEYKGQKNIQQILPGIEVKETLRFANKMEGMQEKELEKRIRYAMDYEIKNKIRPIPYLGVKDEKVIHEYEELIGKCPVTNLPDLYKIKIEYIPIKLIPELKSLRFYFIGYENLPISHEHLVSKVFNDFTKIVEPKWIRIELNVAIRGGIKTTVIKEETF